MKFMSVNSLFNLGFPLQLLVFIIDYYHVIHKNESYLSAFVALPTPFNISDRKVSKHNILANNTVIIIISH